MSQLYYCPNQGGPATHKTEDVLAANDTRETRHVVPTICTAEMLEQIQTKVTRLFVHIVIYYEDSWGNEQTFDQLLALYPHLGVFRAYRQFDYEADQRKAANQQNKSGNPN